MPVAQLHIVLSGPYPTADIDRLLQALAPLDALEEPTVIQIDLRRLERISAPAVAVLVSALLDVDARGVVAQDSTISAPRDADVRRRLQELDVLELLVEQPPTEDFERRRERGSRPCQRFTGADEPGAVATSLTGAIAEVCRSDQFARDAMWFALNEIAQNVVDHADSRGGAVGIAEVTRGGDELEVAIADHGVGIRGSLARNPQHVGLASDLDALRTAVTPGATARPDRPGSVGLGLHLTRLLLHDNGGALVMRSGTAQLEMSTSPSASFGLAPLRGTLMIMRFRTDQPVSLDVLLGSAR